MQQRVGVVLWLSFPHSNAVQYQWQVMSDEVAYAAWQCGLHGSPCGMLKASWHHSSIYFPHAEVLH